MRITHLTLIFLSALVLASCGKSKNITETADAVAAEPTIEELMAGVPEGASRVADQKPYWSYCLDESESDPYSCTARDMYLFLDSRAKRPADADRGGSLILDFDINELGVVDWALVIRGISPEVDAAAIALVKSMPPFMPAIRGGFAIRYRQTVKVKIP
jgi:TonB family protein